MSRSIRWTSAGVLVIAVAVLSGCAMFDPAPVANFSWSPFEPLARTDVRFTDQSTDSGGLFGGGGIATWNWDFGDNDSSTAQNPTHEYEKSGTYIVRLTVTDKSGNTNTSQRTIEVSPSLDGRWTGFIVNPGGFTDQIQFDFNHSASGGIQGTAYYLGVSLACDGISFDPGSKVVRFNLFDLGIRLEGTLDASETRITGYWYVLGVPAQGFAWDVSL